MTVSATCVGFWYAYEPDETVKCYQWRVDGGYVTEIGSLTGEWHKTRAASEDSAHEAWRSYWYWTVR